MNQINKKEVLIDKKRKLMPLYLKTKKARGGLSFFSIYKRKEKDFWEPSRITE